MRNTSEQVPFRMPSAALQTLGDLVELQRGFDLTANERQPGTIPVIGGGGTNGFHAVANVRGPGVALARSGSGFGNAWWVETDFWAHNTIMFVKDFKGNDPKFVYYVLDWIDFSEHNSGGAQPSLNRNFIYPIPVHIPPLPEQRKIAEILRTWDEAIEKLEALRKAKLRRHRALTHSLVFGTRQLDRFRTTDEVAEHRWFTLPATWGIKPIGKLAREVSERNGDAEQHEVLSCSKYDGFVRSLEYFKKQVFSADLSGYKKVWRGDFGFPSNHVEEGSIGLQNLTDVGVVSPIYTVFRFAPEKVDTDYAFAVLKTELYRHIFEVNTSASVDRRGSLRWSEFSKLPFPLPSLAEQRAIAEVLRTAQTDLDALNTEIETLTRQKRGLMQKLLTGEWRVSTEAPVA